MKKTVSCMLIIVLLFVFAFSGDAFAEGKKLSVVTTIFPIYDWVREIAKGSDVEITMLLDTGVDLHSYQPTAQDILKIASCDVFAYVGGESDDWVEGALAGAPNPDRTVVNLLEALGDDIVAEELVEGMETKAEEDEDDEAVEYDEHVWLSLRNAQKLVKALADALSQADPARAETYAANADAYVEKLAALDAEYAAARAGADFDTILFGDRFPFRYLADDYGLSYYAAFAGCSAESEAGFETIVFLAGKVDELGLTTVLTIEGTNHRIAETIVENTEAKEAKVLSLDSMQSVTAGDVKNGTTYLDAMEGNLDALRQALTK